MLLYVNTEVVDKCVHYLRTNGHRVIVDEDLCYNMWLNDKDVRRLIFRTESYHPTVSELHAVWYMLKHVNSECAILATAESKFLINKKGEVL